MQPHEYETLFRVEDGHWWYRQLRRVLHLHLDRYLPAWRDAAILDAGCGTGGNLAHLPGAGTPRRSRLLCRRARARAPARPRAAGARHRHVAALRAASFDAAISMSVIYHQWVRDPADALREIHRVLRPGGLLFLDVPAFESLTSPHDVAVMTARRFTAPELRRLVAACDFEVLRVTLLEHAALPDGVGGAAIEAVCRKATISKAPEAKPGGRNAVLDAAMRIEAAVLARVAMPFGVSIHCVGRKIG